MKLAIMTDTNSGLGLYEGVGEGVFVLPMPVIIGEETFFEGADLSGEEYYKRLALNEDSSTSQPSPESIMKMWNDILGAGYDEILYIPMTSGLSGSCATAMLFAEEYCGRVQVADNHRISVTQMMAVEDAVKLRSEGLSAAEIRRILEEHSFEQLIYVTVDDMKRLARGGRVTPAGAAVASALNLKPVLLIAGDKLDAYAKVRGTKKAERTIIEAIEKNLAKEFAGFEKERIHIFSGGTFVSGAEAKRWRREVAEAFPDFEIGYYPMPCSIAAHLGVGAAAAAICASLA